MAKIEVTSAEGTRHVIELQTKYAMIGRSPTCEVRLSDKSISSNHAKIDLSGPEPYLIDLGSTNGTRVNQKPLDPNGRILLQDRDLIAVGSYQLLFLSQSASEAPKNELAEALAQDALADDTRPFLLVLNGPQAGTKVFFQEPNRKIIIGRGEDCDLALVDAGASRRHAMIQCSMDGARITDLGSKHGTSVNQTPLTSEQATPIKDQQEILIGQTLVRFSDPEEALVASLLGSARPIEIQPKEEKRAAPTAAPTGELFVAKKVTQQPELWSTRELVLLGVGALFWIVGVGLGWEAFR
jgi:pSer/pThr/pTyr-binding forkhead associated (FHA) protein